MVWNRVIYNEFFHVDIIIIRYICSSFFIIIILLGDKGQMDCLTILQLSKEGSPLASKKIPLGTIIISEVLISFFFFF